MRRIWKIASTVAVLAFYGPHARAQAGHQHPAGNAEKLGKVSFPTTCKAEVQPRFERAVAMLHSFWFDEAIRAFQQVATDDPTCAMAHWGVAMTMLGNPLVGQPMPAPRLASALAAAERAGALSAQASPRERGYIDAALALYRDVGTDRRPRLPAYEAAMRSLRDQHPDDAEAAIFYAIAVVANAPASDLTFARQKHAAEILTPLFARQADHPGLAHYIIHAFDSPQLAGSGLAAARRYADIAPSAPHALHMPSHIFTRLGYWDESIATNRRSAAAEPDSNAAVHPMDYMVYAYLQQGRDEEARRVVGRAVQNPDRFYGGIIGYNFAAMPARYALERGRWAEAAQLRVPANAPPYVEAVTRFARAIGAARSAQNAQARDEIARIDSLRDSLQRSGDAYWSTVVEAQRLAAAAWAARASGDDATAVRLARAGAELEETVEKHPVTPGPLLPARELEADLLLDLGRHADALRSYEKTLGREPNRARALTGAARAAQLAKNSEAARKHYAALAKLMDRADADRVEARAAKAFLSGREGR
jgi:tetratricopeptide (TPR) repeat protein